MCRVASLVRFIVRALPNGGIRVIRTGTWASHAAGTVGELTGKEYPVLVHRVRKPGAGRKPGEYWKPESRAAAAAALKEGKSLREAAAASGLSKGTVQRIRKEVHADLPEFCACGHAFGHRGWCRIRFEASERRQKVVAQWHRPAAPQRVEVTPPAQTIRVERCTEKACPFPAVKNGRCRQHLAWDQLAASPLGSSLGGGAMEGLGF